jgi:hypothetical protein
MAVEFWVVVQNGGSFGNCHLTAKGNKHLTVFLPNVRGNQTAILVVQQFLNNLDSRLGAETSAIKIESLIMNLLSGKSTAVKRREIKSVLLSELMVASNGSSERKAGTDSALAFCKRSLIMRLAR